MLGSPPAVDERLEAGQIGLHHLLVAVDREDEGHVDAAPFRDHLPDGGMPALVPGILTSRFGRSIRSCRSRAAGSSRRCPWRGSGRPRSRRSRRLRRSRRGAGANSSRASLDVLYDEVPVRVEHVAVMGPDRLGELLVVVGALLDRLGHDRRIGCEPPDALGDELAQAAAGQVGPLQVVDPRALARPCCRDRSVSSSTLVLLVVRCVVVASR